MIDDVNLGAYNHIVVIYQENHSFDNLYGMWGDVAGKQAEDVRFVDVARQTQARLDGLTFISRISLFLIRQRELDGENPQYAARPKI